MAIAISVILASEGLRGTRVHTTSGEVQQAGEDDHPVDHGVHNVTTIELEEHPTLDTRPTELT